jgi:hypothetical protein
MYSIRHQLITGFFRRFRVVHALWEKGFGLVKPTEELKDKRSTECDFFVSGLRTMTSPSNE